MKLLSKIIIILTILTFQINIAHSESLSGPVLGSISSMFGLRSDPFKGYIKSHDGIDIAAPYGAAVYAMQDGYVTKSGWRGGYGLAVTIDSYYKDVPQVPRVQTTYGHCSVLYAQVGQFVRRGQIISLIGSTGRSTGPHLHFEVTYLGRPVDPIDYLRKLPSYLNYVAKVRSNNRYISNNNNYKNR
ncbi:MAG: M23 family metallopeptidase [Candidatus Gastranaerophilales bacterium]|nr:M23 family metallopeptidase [Candidatus Gastranaerophilales bacterium]